MLHSRTGLVEHLVDVGGVRLRESAVPAEVSSNRRRRPPAYRYRNARGWRVVLRFTGRTRTRRAPSPRSSLKTRQKQLADATVKLPAQRFQTVREPDQHATTELDGRGIRKAQIKLERTLQGFRLAGIPWVDVEAAAADLGQRLAR